MKTLALFILLLAIALFAADTPKPDVSAVGRFQLFSAEVETLMRNTTMKGPYVFRLDTVTGRTWAFTSSTVAGSNRPAGEFWMEIFDFRRGVASE